MKFSITTVATLLPFVASTLHQKSVDKTIGDNIVVSDTSVLSDFQPFTWRKVELASLVKELREMDTYKGSFTNAVIMDKILLSGEKAPFVHEYNESLAQRIIAFVTEANIYGLEIGGAVKQLIICLKSKIDNNVISLLMESNNMEIEAAVLSVFGNFKDTWDTYYPKIREDEELQKRILELIDLDSGNYNIAISTLVNWGASLSSEGENIKILLRGAKLIFSYFTHTLHLYVNYSLQHRKMSPKQVIIELLNADDLKGLILKLAEDYVPTKTSAERGVDLAIILVYLCYPNPAKKILSKSNWNLLPEQKKLRFSSIYGEASKFLLADHMNLKSALDLDFSDAKLVEKLFRSGNSEQFSSQAFRIFKGAFSQEIGTKVGEFAALILLAASRNPIKYSWVSAKFNNLLYIIYMAIESGQLSFDTNAPNPIMAALDLAFDGGEIVDLVVRYNNSRSSFYDIIEQEETRGRYGRDVQYRFDLKRLIGDEDYYNFLDSSQMRCRIPNIDLSHNIDSISKVDLWKRMMRHSSRLRNPVA